MANKKKSFKNRKSLVPVQSTTIPGKDSVVQRNKKLKSEKTGWKESYLTRPLLPGSWKINAAIFLLLIIATVVLYSGDLHLGFFRVDDQQYVVNNPWIRSFSAQNLNHILTTPYFVNYSPLHLFSYMFDYSFAGADGYVFHLSGNLWAGWVAGFVFLTALAFTGRRIIAI